MYLHKVLATMLLLAFATGSYADKHSDNYDLDDIRGWDIVKIETCLDSALDTIPGHPRKVEFKLEGDDPVYEFDIEHSSGITYNVECNAEEGYITEIEKEVASDDAYFKKHARISEKEARDLVLSVHPGKIAAMEYEIGQDGSVTYEYDVQTELGHEIKVDVDATTGKIEEANIELYEIGGEKE